MRGWALALFPLALLAGCGEAESGPTRHVPAEAELDCTVVGIGACSTEGAVIDFGSVPVGGVAERTILLSNQREDPIRVDRIERGDLPAAFEHSLLCGEDDCYFHELGKNGSLEVRVRFAPESEGEFEAALPHEAWGALTLVGSGTVPSSGPPLALDCDEQVDFGDVFVGARKSTVLECVNVGEYDAVIDFVSMNELEKEFSHPMLRGQLIEPGETFRFDLSIVAQAAGKKSSSISLRSAQSVVEVPLVATAFDDPLFFAEEGCVDFGSAALGTEQKRFVAVENPTSAAVELGDISIEGTAFSIAAAVATIPAGQQAMIEVDFAPTEAGSVEGALHFDVKWPLERRQTLCLRGTGQ